MTNDNPLEVDCLSDLEEALDDFYQLRGYLPKEVVIKKYHYNVVYDEYEAQNPFARGQAIFGRPEEFTIWMPQGMVTIKKESDSYKASSGGYSGGGWGSSNKKKCCDNPNIIANNALGKMFYVCRNCKKETDKDGYPV